MGAHAGGSRARARSRGCPSRPSHVAGRLARMHCQWHRCYTRMGNQHRPQSIEPCTGACRTRLAASSRTAPQPRKYYSKISISSPMEKEDDILPGLYIALWCLALSLAILAYTRQPKAEQSASRRPANKKKRSRPAWAAAIGPFPGLCLVFPLHIYGMLLWSGRRLVSDHSIVEQASGKPNSCSAPLRMNTFAAGAGCFCSRSGDGHVSWERWTVPCSAPTPADATPLLSTHF